MFAQAKRIKTIHIFIFILLLGSFLRLYRLRETMQFLGDQGRDALIVRRMLIEHHPALIGPVTSVGNMYLGPLYYYFMLFPLMLTYPDPSGPSIAVAIVGIFTLGLLYVLGKEILGERAALIATVVYAVSPLVLTFSRFSWNPNIVPLFSLLFFWHMYKVLKGNEKAWVFIGLWVSILVQLHYITLILGAFAGLIWIYQLIIKMRAKQPSGTFIVSTIKAAGIFLVSLIPLIAFDVRHNNTNLKAFEAFFAGNGQHFRFFDALYGIFITFMTLFVRNVGGLFSLKAPDSLKLIFFVFLAVLLGYVVLKKQSEHRMGERLLIGIFSFSCLFLALYRSTVYDHYLGFLYPIGALLIGVLMSSLWKKMGAVPMSVCIAVLVVISLSRTPFKENLGYNIFMMKTAADAIQAHVKPGESYDILVFTDTNDYQGMNYRYFLTTGKEAPASEEQIHEFKTLFILDEQNHGNPVDGPQYKIAMWPNRKVIDRFDIPGGPRVFELKR